MGCFAAPFLFIRTNKNRMKGVFPLVLIIVIIGLTGCLLDKGELVQEVTQDYCDTLQATYTDTMKTLIDVHCASSFGCHGAQATNGDFTTYANLQATGMLSESKIGARIASNNLSLVMPPGNPLPDSLKKVFQCWVNDGFPQQ